jgi:dTDP-4-amino-4,6-dideoxygalactose transaminase
VKAQAARPNIPMLDLRAQHAELETELLEAFQSVLASGRFILGDPVESFEAELAKLCESRFAIACNSGTDALWLAMRGLGVGPGDAVLCPAFSFFASASTIARLGARPVFVDIDAETFHLDPEDAMRRADEHGTVRALMSVDLFGRLCDLESLRPFCDERDIMLFEDAAQSIGGLDPSGAGPGQRSRIACLSFYPTKNLGALGDAGGLVTSDPDLARRISRLRVHGEGEPGIYEEIGINSRLDALQAAALSIKLRHLEGWTRTRRQLAAHYDTRFAERGAHPASTPLGSGDLPLQTPTPTRAPGRHAYHRYVVRVPGELRSRVVAALRDEGIASEVYYRLGLHQQPALAEYAQASGTAGFPETERAAREALALPLYPELHPDGIDRVVDCVARALER